MTVSHIPDDVMQAALSRFHETAEELAEIENFEGWIPGCDYEPVFKACCDLQDARDLIASIRDERDAILAEREKSRKRVEELEEVIREYWCGAYWKAMGDQDADRVNALLRARQEQ